jgi:hypothetical protein
MPEPGTDVAVITPTAIQSWRSAGTVEELVARADLVHRAMQVAMTPNVHYGIIPGTGNKPTLLKPGAEKLDTLFRLRPEFRDELAWDGEHLTVTSYCSLVHIATGDVLAKDVAGMCSTKESKYAWRQAVRRCPNCGQDAIRKVRKEGAKNFGKWQCIGGDKGGCWSVFEADDHTITGQDSGRVPNPDLADQYNTVLKMSQKRAHVAATLAATAASDVFTQDVEDMPQFGGTPEGAVEVETLAPTGNGGTSPARKAPAKPAQAAESKGGAKMAVPAQIGALEKTMAPKHSVSPEAIAKHYGGVTALAAMTYGQAGKAIQEMGTTAKGSLAWAMSKPQPSPEPAKASEAASGIPASLATDAERLGMDAATLAEFVSGWIGRDVTPEGLGGLAGDELAWVGKQLAETQVEGQR